MLVPVCLLNQATGAFGNSLPENWVLLLTVVQHESLARDLLSHILLIVSSCVFLLYSRGQKFPPHEKDRYTQVELEHVKILDCHCFTSLFITSLSKIR